jgi:hypothetical protein
MKHVSIVFAAALGAAALYGSLPTRAADGIYGEEAAKTVPIADAHFHVTPFMNVADLPGYMERNGIRWAGGAGNPGGPGRTAEVVAALGKRYIFFTGQGEWLGLKQAGGPRALENGDSPAFKAALDNIERGLRDRDARVIGEIHVNTLQSAPSGPLRHKVRADAPTLKALLDLAAKYKRPMNVHAQWDSDTAEEIERLAASNRGGRLVLSHCGSTASAADIRAVFERNPNLSCDLSFRSEPQLRGPMLGYTVYTRGDLRPEWKKLIEDYPDRFMAGIDDVQSWNEYEEIVRNIRSGLLANLSPATAEKVAYKNAVALFGLE